jgi:dockerin type I repeat protein
MSLRFPSPRLLALAALLVLVMLTAPKAHAVGEPVNGFPNWQERLLLEWTNRARSDPQAELANCTTGNCLEKACYSQMPPLAQETNLSRSARFHSDEMFHQAYFDHPSKCTLPLNISSSYPGSCDGSASCACAGGTYTDPWARISMFGQSGLGEIIAAWYDGVDPLSIFYLWLYESTSTSTCGFNDLNGHRWLMLASNAPSVGYGASHGYFTGDFGTGGTTSKIPSGAHTPQSGATIDFWANWFDTAAPKSATVNIDGTCTNLTLARGTPQNGAWHAQVGNLGTACHRYYFSFKDANGNTVTYPTTGSFGVGPSCPDWTSTRPNPCGGTTAAKGDANGDGKLDANDVFYLVNALFAGGPAPVGSGDVNASGAFDVHDVFYLIDYLYAGGPAPK